MKMTYAVLGVDPDARHSYENESPRDINIDWDAKGIANDWHEMDYPNQWPYTFVIYDEAGEKELGRATVDREPIPEFIVDEWSAPMTEKQLYCVSCSEYTEHFVDKKVICCLVCGLEKSLEEEEEL